MPEMPEFSDMMSAPLPYHMEAEQSVLGAVLIDSTCLPRVLEYISPDCFYRQQHKGLFSIMLTMFTTAQPIDFVTVLEQAQNQSVFSSDQEAKVYLTQLVQMVPSTSNIEAYARIVQEKFYIRSLMFAAKDIIEMAGDGAVDARTLLDSAEQKIYDIRKGRDVSGLIRIDEIIMQAYDELQKLSGEDRAEHMGIPTGIPTSTDHHRAQPLRPHFDRGAPRHGQNRLCAQHCHQRGHQVEQGGGGLFARNEPRAAGAARLILRGEDRGAGSAHRHPQGR